LVEETSALVGWFKMLKWLCWYFESLYFLFPSFSSSSSHFISQPKASSCFIQLHTWMVIEALLLACLWRWQMRLLHIELEEQRINTLLNNGIYDTYYEGYGYVMYI
jgi:hypothetical protein